MNGRMGRRAASIPIPISTGNTAAAFRCNGELLDLLPKGIIAFLGSGITGNLVEKVGQRGISHFPRALRVRRLRCLLSHRADALPLLPGTVGDSNRITGGACYPPTFIRAISTGRAKAVPFALPMSVSPSTGPRSYPRLSHATVNVSFGDQIGYQGDWL